MAATAIRVTSLIISEFRKFKDRRIDFPKPVTLITGQNGTAKSTVLGMLAQPFSFGSEQEKQKEDNSSYIDNYHGLRLSDYVDIAGNFYTYTCDKIFRLSKKHDTPDKRYIYETKLKGIDFKVDIASPLKAKKLLTVPQTRAGRLRFVTGPALQDSESVSHNSGEGNFPHPVIYLSLGRLRPLAEVKECEISSAQGSLDSNESGWYEAAYKEIFSIVDESPSTGLMETKEKKRSIVPLTQEYDGESCSAGQDNIGRLLTAILSFRRLKNSLGDHYRGGLLLVDEIDATLHPASQVRLMRLLCREAAGLSLQIVATTHSLYLTEACFQELKKYVGIVHIRKHAGNLDIKSDATFEDLKADLENIAIPPPKRQKTRKVSVLLEDTEAIRLFQFLVAKNPRFKGRLAVANINVPRKCSKPVRLSGEYLRIFADNARRISELHNIVFVPDGDLPWVETTKNENVVALPGKRPIEVQIFEMLKAMADDDPFWKECQGQNYHKQVAIGNSTNLVSTDIDAVKKWYRKQKPFWGRGMSIVLSRYYDANKKVCDVFLEKLERIIRRCE